MKIVQVTPGRFHHFDLAREIAKRGEPPVVFSSYPAWKLVEHDEYRGLDRTKIHTFPYVNLAFLAMNRVNLDNKLVSLTRRALCTQMIRTLDLYVKYKLEHCDVLVAQSGCGSISGPYAKAKFGSKYICDRGSSHIAFMDSLLREEFIRWKAEYLPIDPALIEAEATEYAAADCITVPSQFSAQSFVTLGVAASKLKIVPYGVDVSKFCPVATADPNEFNLLFVGAVNFRKGIPYLLDAFERFQHKKKKLVIIGEMDSSMRTYLRGRGVDNRVEFKGHMPQSQLKEVMSRSTALVLPSVEDGFGLVMAQAMACGCPVVSSTNTGGPDLYSHGREGFIVPARSANHLLDCFVQLASDSAARRVMSDRSIDRVKSLGGWSNYGDRYVQLLTEMCDSPLTSQ